MVMVGWGFGGWWWWKDPPAGNSREGGMVFGGWWRRAVGQWKRFAEEVKKGERTTKGPNQVEAGGKNLQKEGWWILHSGGKDLQGGEESLY